MLATPGPWLLPSQGTRPVFTASLPDQNSQLSLAARLRRAAGRPDQAVTTPHSLPEPVRRAEEIEDFSNLLVVHPIANRLTVWLAAVGVRPNAVSLAGMACGILAGVAYSRVGDRRFVVIGFILMLAWHVMDGADGQLARLTRTQSRLGKILDGVCDYVTFAAVYVGLALALAPRHGGWVYGLVAVSGACHAMQSAIYEAQREEYALWGLGRQGHKPPKRGGDARAAARVPDLLHGIYVKMQAVGVGANAGLRRKLAAAVAQAPEDDTTIRQRYRDVFAPVVRRWSMLSANTRTLAIFVCGLFGMPLLFFWLETIVLSLATVILLSALPARYRLFLRGLPVSAASG